MKQTGQYFTVLVVCERCGVKGALEVHQSMSVAKLLQDQANEAYRKKVAPPAWGYRELAGGGHYGVYCRGCIDLGESLIALQKDQVSAFVAGHSVRVEVPAEYAGVDDECA